MGTCPSEYFTNSLHKVCSSTALSHSPVKSMRVWGFGSGTSIVCPTITITNTAVVCLQTAGNWKKGWSCQQMYLSALIWPVVHITLNDISSLPRGMWSLCPTSFLSGCHAASMAICGVYPLHVKYPPALAVYYTGWIGWFPIHLSKNSPSNTVDMYVTSGFRELCPTSDLPIDNS